MKLRHTRIEEKHLFDTVLLKSMAIREIFFIQCLLVGYFFECSILLLYISFPLDSLLANYSYHYVLHKRTGKV